LGRSKKAIGQSSRSAVLATVVKIVFMRAWAAQHLLHVGRGEALGLEFAEVLGLELAGIGRDAEHVLHEQALALRQREHGRIGAEAVERRLVETQLGQVSARGAETTVAPSGVGDDHEGDHPASQENADGSDGLNRLASTVTRALRICGEGAYVTQLRGKVSTPRKRLSSSSHWRASGEMSSSLETSKKAMGHLPSG
jgi:hypothetical protein